MDECHHHHHHHHHIFVYSVVVTRNTITNHLSVSEHVRDVIGKCGQTMYVLKVLRSHGLNDAASTI